MYRSPIDLIFADMSSYMEDIAKKLDEDIWQAIVRYDVNIDKDELLRALKYDRDQYEKGYADGEADATPRWIPVTERLPELVDSYLVVVKAKYDYEDEYEIDVDVATYNPYEKAYIDGCWNTYNDWDEGQQYLHVTHWMPLPEPPKELDPAEGR